MIPFSGLLRFRGHFDGDGLSPLNRDTTVPSVSLICHTYLEEVVLWWEGVASAGGAQARDVPVVELDVPRVVGGEGHADLGLEHLVGALEDVRSGH